MLNRNIKQYLNKRFLNSGAYAEIMTKYLEEGGNWFNLVDKSKNFTYRAANLAHFGAWRWLSLYQFREYLMDLVFSDAKGIDFGGGNGPIGGNARIVDKDPTFFLTIDDITSNSLDYIFTSHTLEHVDNMEETLIQLWDLLKVGGRLIIIVPSYTCVRWRAGNNNSHKLTFALEGEEYTRIDKKVENAGFELIKSEYCWDDSIFMIGRKI